MEREQSLSKPLPTIPRLGFRKCFSFSSSMKRIGLGLVTSDYYSGDLDAHAQLWTRLLVLMSRKHFADVCLVEHIPGRVSCP